VLTQGCPVCAYWRDQNVLASWRIQKYRLQKEQVVKEGKINRKEFIYTLGAGSLLLSQTILGGSGCSGETGNRPVEVSRKGFVIDGKIYPLYSGSFHYWRHKAALWPDIFDQLSRMGVNTISTGIPWEVHELERGSFDFGRYDKSKDIGAFIDLAADKGFKVIVCPGPQLGCDLTYYGLPQRILFDPEIAARTSVDTVEVLHSVGGQFPVPSYYSEKFYQEVGIYFEALMPILARRLHTRGGPIIAMQADNELSFFHRIRRPYTIDYHPSALALYRKHLEEKYEGRIQGLNRGYGTNYESFALVEPPRRFAGEKMQDLPAYLDWVEFREWSVIWSLERISMMFTERGISGIPFIDSTLEDFRAPVNIPAAEAVDLIALDGIDGYPRRENFTEERELCRAAAGLNLYPFRPEFGAGYRFSEQLLPRWPEDLEFTTLTCFMHGIKGLNYYMAVERDRWLASPVTRDGRIRGEFYKVYRRIFQFLRENRVHDLQKVVEIIFLYNNALDRLSCSIEQGKDSADLNIGGEVFAETVDFGFQTSPEACGLWTEQTTGIMRDAGFDWNIGTTGLSAERLLEYKVAVLPTIDFLYAGDLEALEKYVRGGGILVFGPERPTLDERMNPDRRIRDFFEQAESVGGYQSTFSAGSLEDANNKDNQEMLKKISPVMLIHIESPLEISGLLKTLDVNIPFTRSNSNLDISLHQAGDGRRVLFIANGTARQQLTDLFFPGSHSFRSLWDGKDCKGEGKVKVELEPYKIGIWEVS